MPGILVVDGAAFSSYEQEEVILKDWCDAMKDVDFTGIQMIVLVDDASFTAANENNFVWVTFTRSNPAYDIYGVNSFTKYKHWGCYGPVIIDARRKPHHAPDLIKDPAVEKRVDAMGVKGGSLHGII